MGNHWLRIWQQKGREPLALNGSPEEVLRNLLRFDGYDSRTSTLSLDDWAAQVEYVSRSLCLIAADTVYEVGCGAGALLHSLQARCRAVGGLDYSEPLLAIARKVLQADDLILGEAFDLPESPRYDHVVSLGAFLYFPDEDYARTVVRKMVAKAKRVVAVLDVNDAARRDLALALRRAAQADIPGQKAGLEQLFLPREFFHELAVELGCELRIDESVMRQSLNSRYRYNVFLERTGRPPSGCPTAVAASQP